MIYDFLEKLTGAWGPWLMAFYAAHSLAINLVVLLYGLVLWLSWRNLGQIRQQLITAIAEQIEAAPEADARRRLANGITAANIPWNQALARSWFPLVAQQWALWPRRCSTSVLQALLPSEELTAAALERRETAERPTPRQEEPEERS